MCPVPNSSHDITTCRLRIYFSLLWKNFRDNERWLLRINQSLKHMGRNPNSIHDLLPYNGLRHSVQMQLTFNHGVASGVPVRSAVASWLVRSSLDRAVWVQALAGDIVLCSWARHFTLTVPLSTQCINWYPQIVGENRTNCGEVTSNGLASCPEEGEILLAASWYRNWDKLRQLWASHGSKASLLGFMN